MKIFKSKIVSKAFTVLILCLLVILSGLLVSPLMRVTARAQSFNGGQSFFAGSQTSVFPNYNFGTATFTATSQNATVTTGGVSNMAVQLVGSSLTTVTWQLTCSVDGGTHYFGIPSMLSTATMTATYNTLPIVTAGTITSTANGLYFFNVASCTNLKIATSGTFTATNVAFTLVGTPNSGLL